MVDIDSQTYEPVSWSVTVPDGVDEGSYYFTMTVGIDDIAGTTMTMDITIVLEAGLPACPDQGEIIPDYNFQPSYTLENVAGTTHTFDLPILEASPLDCFEIISSDFGDSEDQ